MPPPYSDTGPYATLTLLTAWDYERYTRRAVQRATSSIDLAMYMASPPPSLPNDRSAALWNQLRLAPTRQVACRAILNASFPSGQMSHYNYRASHELAGSGWKVRLMPRPQTLHAKTWIFDRHLSIIGSHNLALSSVPDLVNISVAINDQLFGALLRHTFDSIWSHADPL